MHIAGVGVCPVRCCAATTLTHCILSKTKLNCYSQIDKTDVPLQLIDIGKVIHVESLSDHKIYNLTQEAKLTPIRANLCKIEKVINFHFRLVISSAAKVRLYYYCRFHSDWIEAHQ